MRTIPPVNWPLLTLDRSKNTIDIQPRYQRGPVWKLPQKQLLIDSILRGMDIPKLYFRKTQSAPDKYQVIDGQQRIRTIWDFYSNTFALASEFSQDLGCGDKKFGELEPDSKNEFDRYNITIVVIEDARDDEVEDMFVRLQNGTSLVPAEKRNAIHGGMRDFVKALARHDFWSRVGFENERFAFDEAAAQCVLLEIAGGPAPIYDRDLVRLYKQNARFDSNSAVANKVRQNLTYLARAFPRTPELTKQSIPPLYLTVTLLSKTLALKGVEEALRAFFQAFEQERRREREKPPEEQDRDLAAYNKAMIGRSRGRDTLQVRFEVFGSRFLIFAPDIQLLDPQRGFTREQRLAIYRRDKETCQECRTHVDFAQMEADHTVPWASGGKTTVQNGRTLCRPCNRSKGTQG